MVGSLVGREPVEVETDERGAKKTGPNGRSIAAQPTRASKKRGVAGQRETANYSKKGLRGQSLGSKSQ
jgi:hypothetical protein